MQRSEKLLFEELALVLGNMTTGGLSKAVAETADFKSKSPPPKKKQQTFCS